MEDLFRQFWWLIFPVFGMAMGVYGMWNDQRRRRDTIELLKVYAEKGQEPPAEMLKAVARSSDDMWENGGFGPDDIVPRQRNPYGEWRNLALYLSLGAAFLFAAWFGPGSAQWAFVMVAIIMGGLAAGSLIMALLKQRDARR